MVVPNKTNMENKNYNEEIKTILINRGGRALNQYVMDHTYRLCKNDSVLSKHVEKSINDEVVIYENDSIVYAFNKNPTVNIEVSRRKSFEAAKQYRDKKVVVLNFANNHHIGGSPWSSFAQEESLCRASTLFPCLEAKKKEFYLYHSSMFDRGEIGYLGNDDIIYSPNIVVFKTDGNLPLMLEEKDWCKVDIITCAAPNLRRVYNQDIKELEIILDKKAERILQVAQANGAEVLILGAFGCGAFYNPPELVASSFKKALSKYFFEKVEFAVYCHDDSTNYIVFKKVIENN